MPTLSAAGSLSRHWGWPFSFPELRRIILHLFCFAPSWGKHRLPTAPRQRTVCFRSWLTCLISKTIRQEAIMSCILERDAQLTIGLCQTPCERCFGLGWGRHFVEQTCRDPGVEVTGGDGPKRTYLFSQNAHLEMQACREQQRRFIVVPDEKCMKPISSDTHPHHHQIIFIKPLILLCIYVPLSAAL